MEPTKQQQNMQPIDLMEIVHVMLSRFWLILFSGILVGICALIYTKATTTPVYTSSTKMYILSKTEDSAAVNSSDMSLSATLATDYAQLIKDRTVMESVVSELGLSMSAEALASKVSVTLPNSGRIVTISVSDPDPYMASKLANQVRDMGAMHIQEVMDTGAINVVEEANIPKTQTLGSYKRNGMMGALAGMVIAMAIIYIRFLMNDTIRRPEDVERYLGVSVLGSIPMMDTGKKGKKKK
ncbi:MAG: YveK family protein [Marvinbryantia sp.]|jgi:capsular polysaccharide biosynthesis protein